MDDREKLEKMDMLRTRFNLSYAEAREALEAANWDPVEATIRLESARNAGGAGKAGGSFYEELKVTGGDLIDTIKRLLHEGNVNRIVIRDTAGKELFNLPVNGLIVVTALIPILTAIGAVAVVAMEYTVLVERRA